MLIYYSKICMNKAQDLKIVLLEYIYHCVNQSFYFLKKFYCVDIMICLMLKPANINSIISITQFTTQLPENGKHSFYKLTSNCAPAEPS